MPIPSAPKADATVTSNVVSSAPVAGEKKAVVIKQFGTAKDDAGNDRPAPSPMGFDLVEACKDTYNFILAALAKKGIDPQKFVDALDINKETVPGHKSGKAAYATANAFAAIFKQNGLLNKERGASGYAKKDAIIAQKSAAVEALRAKLIAMNVNPAEIDALLAG